MFRKIVVALFASSEVETSVVKWSIGAVNWSYKCSEVENGCSELELQV